MLVDKIHEESGCQILIGWSFKRGEEIIEGAVSPDGLEWSDACKMLVGINGYVADHYGNHGVLNPEE